MVIFVRVCRSVVIFMRVCRSVVFIVIILPRIATLFAVGVLMFNQSGLSLR